MEQTIHILAKHMDISPCLAEKCLGLVAKKHGMNREEILEILFSFYSLSRRDARSKDIQPTTTQGQLQEYYSIVGEIAQGGNSDVFLVVDKKGRNFAAKIPHENMGHLIVQEANLFEAVQPHVRLGQGPFLEFYGLFTFENQPAMVMEYFSGRPLYKIKQRHQLPYVRWICGQLYTGLNMLHTLGFTHGDVHNGNILVDNSRMVLLDLSGCLFTRKNTNLSCTGFSCNEELMAPREIWNKIKDDVSLLPSRDVFEAGMLLRWMITDFPSPSSQDFLQSPRDFRVKIPQDLALQRIINGCIHADPRRRWTAQKCLDVLKEG